MIVQIERLRAQSGGFGVFLDMAHNWADFEQTRRSYELIARYVMPRFQGQVERQGEAYRWAMERKPELAERRQAGIDQAHRLHAEDRVGAERRAEESAAAKGKGATSKEGDGS